MLLSKPIVIYKELRNILAPVAHNGIQLQSFDQRSAALSTEANSWYMFFYGVYIMFYTDQQWSVLVIRRKEYGLTDIVSNEGRRCVSLSEKYFPSRH